MMNYLESAAGMVELELTGADLPKSFLKINESGIRMTEIRMKDKLSAEFLTYRKDYKRIKALCDKNGDALRILEKKGVYWRLKALLQRPVLIAGVLILIILMTYIPTRIFFVQVEGNTTIPARLILEAAEESGIGFGASRREVRSEKMKNSLLAQLPQLQWAGVNTYGCTAVITVRERSVQEQSQTDSQPCSIVAVRDGVIEACTVTRGSGLCGVGQAVQEGQVLISGFIDCGLSIQLTRAEGEIMARTSRELTVIAPGETVRRVETGVQKTNFSLLIGKKRINFYKGSGICDASCVKMYSEYVLSLPGGFELPVKLIKETILETDLQSVSVSEDQISLSLAEFASGYLGEQMIAGQIQQRQERITSEDGVICLTGEYACTEMIGRRRQEQIGEQNGKTD